MSKTRPSLRFTRHELCIAEYAMDIAPEDVETVRELSADDLRDWINSHSWHVGRARLAYPPKTGLYDWVQTKEYPDGEAEDGITHVRLEFWDEEKGVLTDEATTLLEVGDE